MVFGKPQFAIFILITFCFQDIFCHTHRKMLLVGKLKCVSYLIVNYLFTTDDGISEGRKVSIRTFSIRRNLIWRDEFLPSNVGIKISNLREMNIRIIAKVGLMVLFYDTRTEVLPAEQVEMKSGLVQHMLSKKIDAIVLENWKLHGKVNLLSSFYHLVGVKTNQLVHALETDRG
jgi:hypothetical protein